LARPRFSFQNLPGWLRGRFSDTQRFVFLCMLAGILCGLVGVGFHVCIRGVFAGVLWVADWLDATEPSLAARWLILAPALGGLIAGLIVTFIDPRAAGSGIPQTKESYYHNFGNIPLRTGFWRFIAGTFAVGSGNSLGREGPTIHICAAVASQVGRSFGLAKARVQAMVPVGMGAGIAAAFNTPLAAITFVFEKLLDNFSSKALGGILVAVIVAAVVERSILGEKAALNVPDIEYETAPWMLIALPLGVVAAVTGHLFSTGLLFFRRRIGAITIMPRWLRPALGGLLMGVVGYVILRLTGGSLGVFSTGYEDLNHALRGELVWQVLGLLLIGKIAATTLCYASGNSGGIFSPVLFIGSMLGGLFGVLANQIFQPEQSVLAATALLGMGAFFAAVIRCPVTSVLMLVEMTRNYSLILPLMAGNMIAYLLATRLRPLPIYDALLVQDGISLKKLPSYQGERDWRNLPVSAIMTHDVVTVNADDTVEEALANVPRKKHAYPVVDGPRHALVGIVTRHELEELRDHSEEGGNKRLREIVEGRRLVTLHPETSIRDTANKLVVEDVLQAPVVPKTNPKRLAGIVTLHDIARQQNAINETIER
jgi:CIC family chloride channel protein